MNTYIHSSLGQYLGKDFSDYLFIYCLAYSNFRYIIYMRTVIV